MATRDPLSRLTKNLFTLQRFGNTVSAAGQEVLDELFREIVADLQRIDPTAPSLERWRRYRTEQFVAEVEARIAEAVPLWRRAVQDGLALVGRSQGKFAEGLLVASIGSTDGVTRTPVTQSMARAILNADPFEGSLLKEWADGLGGVTLRRVRRQVRLGMLAEESIPDLVRRIRGRQAKGAARGFVGGVLQATTRDAETIVRTAVTHIANRAMAETYKANEKILAGVRFTSTMDDRTTVICGSLDGTVWPIGSDEVRTPPLHPNCRSVLVPEVDWEGLGLDPPPDGERFARDLSGVSEEDLERKVSARRRTGDLGGRANVSSSTTFSDWLRRQPVRVQERVLKSRRRAELFRQGEVTLKELVTKDGNLIALDELSL